MIASPGPFRRRYKTWEAALLHFGFTPDQVAERLQRNTAPRDANPEGYVPPGLPLAELAPVLGRAVAGLDGDAVQRLVAAYRGLPQRSRYVLTARLGLVGGAADGGASTKTFTTQTLSACAQPLGLHLDRVRQLQLAAIETIAEVTFKVSPSDQPQRELASQPCVSWPWRRGRTEQVPTAVSVAL